MARRGALLWVALIAVAAAVQWAPRAAEQITSNPVPPRTDAREPVRSSPASPVRDPGVAAERDPEPRRATDCADPSPERGVSARGIRLGALGVQSGPGASFHGPVAAALASVVRDVNTAGGVCGRLLRLEQRDTGWDALRGARFFDAMVERGILAFVGIEDRTLRALLEDGSLDRAGVPVVGATAGARETFDGRWVWHVTPPRDAYGWASVAHGYRLGARTFGVVYDRTDPGSVAVFEGARDAAADRPGARVVGVPLSPSRASYSREIAAYNGRCQGRCDVVVLAVPASTALTWLAGGPQHPAMHYATVPELLSEAFRQSCGADCEGMISWSPFALDEEAPLDASSIAALAASVGARALVDALRALVEPPTHESLAASLDAGTFASPLTAEPLSWAASRIANRWVRGYRMDVDALGRASVTSVTGWLEYP